MFVDLLRGTLGPSIVIYASLAGGFTGYLLYSFLTGPVNGQSYALIPCMHHLSLAEQLTSLVPRSSAADRKPVRPTIITLLLLHCLSPILRTLTEATTSDSIWPLAGVLLVLGLILGDYGSKPETAKG